MSINQITDLTKEYKYKIELHAHTRPASPCSEIEPKRLIELYAEKGFDGVVITNHFVDFLIKSENPKEAADIYLKDYYEAVSEGEKRGIKVYLGMEVRFPESCNDYLVYGIGEQDIGEVFSYIHSDYITFYKNFKNGKNIILQAHPFRNGMELQNPDYIDGIEVFNMHPNHNSRVAVAARYAAEHKNFIKIGGTDFHHNNHQGLAAMLSKRLPEDSVDLARILKDRDYLLSLSGSIIIP